MFNLLFRRFSNTLSLYSIGQGSYQIFCCFPPILLQGFCPLRPVRLLYPSFFIYFQVSCIFSCIMEIILNLWKFGDFDDLSLFFHNWSMGFCCGMLYNCSMCINLINLLNFWKLGISRACNYPNLGFCSIWFNLMKLTCWIDSYDHYNVLSILCNDQLVNFLKIVQVVFQNFRVFDLNFMLKPILWF